MSRSATIAASERIDGVGCDGWPNVRLQPFPTRHIDRAVEQTGDIVLQAGVVENRNVGSGIEFNHDVDVAVGPIVATRTRAKDRRVPDAARARRFRWPAAWR